MVGDRVTLDNLDPINATGRIINVLERQNQLTRPKIANITKAMVVSSIQNPILDLQQLDRYVTHILLAGIEPMICISKKDLTTGSDEIEAIQRIYQHLNIPVYTTSIKDLESIQHLFNALQGGCVVFAGPSGAGKSSLINSFRPSLNLKVQEVSEKIQRGQHTTRQVALLAMGNDTYIADTPGFSYLKFDDILPQVLESVFPDFASYRDHCHFHNCLHLDEEECQVKANLENLSETRYESYKIFVTEATHYIEKLQTTSQKQEYGYKKLKKGKDRDISILKLPEKQRETSRRTQKQQILDWTSEEDATLEES